MVEGKTNEHLDSELLDVEWLTQDIRSMLGSPTQKAYCLRCGEEIINEREIVENELTLCMAYAGQAYYRLEDSETIKAKNMPEIQSYVWMWLLPETK